MVHGDMRPHWSEGGEGRGRDGSRPITDLGMDLWRFRVRLRRVAGERVGPLGKDRCKGMLCLFLSNCGIGRGSEASGGHV